MEAQIIAGQLPLGYCYPSSAQQLLNDFSEISHAEVSDNVTGVAIGTIDPGAQYPLWFHTGSARIFHLLDGVRVSRYWADADPDYRIFTEKTEPQIAAWDNPGGPAAIVGALTYTGPFWAVDHNYDGRFVIGPGTLPGSTLVIAVTDTGGADEKTLDITHVPPHRHSLTLRSTATSYLAAEAAEIGEFHASSLEFEEVSGTKVGRTKEAGGTTGVVQPFDVMPPYRAAFVIKRTGRIWYTP